MDVDSSVGIYLFFVFEAKLSDIASLDLAVGDVDVFSGYIDVVEKVEIHVVVVGFRVDLRNWEVFVKVEGDHVFEG